MQIIHMPGEGKDSNRQFNQLRTQQIMVFLQEINTLLENSTIITSKLQK